VDATANNNRCCCCCLLACCCCCLPPPPPLLLLLLWLAWLVFSSDLITFGQRSHFFILFLT
jgi:hypothetical protein